MIAYLKYILLPHRTVGQASQAASTSDGTEDCRLTRLGDSSPESGTPEGLEVSSAQGFSHTNGHTESNSEEDEEIDENNQSGTITQEITLNGQEETNTDISRKNRKTKKQVEVIRNRNKTAVHETFLRPLTKLSTSFVYLLISLTPYSILFLLHVFK